MLTTINITNGPSREDLFDDLRLIAENRTIPFVLETEGGVNQRLNFFMEGIDCPENEHERGEDWIIRITPEKSSELLEPVVLKPELEEIILLGKDMVLQTLYSTRTRKSPAISVESRLFSLAGILSLTTGKSLAEKSETLRGIPDEVFELIHFMTGKTPFLQFGNGEQEVELCKNILFLQIPWLKTIDVSEVTTENWRYWLLETMKMYGEQLRIKSLS